MSFLEDLRKQKAAREQEQLIARQNTERERIASMERARDQQLQEEQARRLEQDKASQIERQLKQAEEYFAKSEFVRLSKELASTVEGIVLVKGAIDPDVAWDNIHRRLKYHAYSDPDYHYPRDYNVHELSPDDKRYYLDKSNPLSEVGVSLIWLKEQKVHKKRDHDIGEDIYGLLLLDATRQEQLL